MLRARLAVASAATIITVVACEEPPARAPVPKAMATSGEIQRRRDHALTLELQGLKTLDARKQYAELTVTSCEGDDVPESCIKASSVVETRIGKSLLFHGCSLGSDDACFAFMSQEMKLEKKSRELALVDAQQALALGCTSGKDGACKSLRSFTGYPASSQQQTQARTEKAYTQKLLDEVRDTNDRIASQSACIASCTEEQKACKHRCSVGVGAVGECVSDCSDRSIDCSRFCRQKAMNDCQKATHADCDFLR
jgi:hypothetical protein